MRLLVVRGDLQSHSGYTAAARDYCEQMEGLFDHVVGVDIHFSCDRPYELFPHSLLSEDEARSLVKTADFALVLSMTTPDCYTRYSGAVNVGLTFWETDRLPLQGRERSPWVDQANAMDALWLPSSHTLETFRTAGVTVPMRVIPWPIHVPARYGHGLPDGEVFDLDRRPWLAESLAGLARFNENRFRWSRWLMRHGAPRARRHLLDGLRCSTQAIADPAKQAFLCVAQDVPRKGLRLFLAEWMDFKRRPEAERWSLILKTSSLNPQTQAFDFVASFWEHIQALKRQLGVRQAGVYLWTGDLGGADFHRLMANTYGQIAASMGEGFCGPAALALGMGKPLVAPRHTAFADYIAADHRYLVASRPAHVRFVDDPLRVYDPASSWHVPEPSALANALSCLVTDNVEVRADACLKASSHLTRWCGAHRVSALLAEEVRRLGLPSPRIAAA
jgi:glycosyltransferase involved in cell wall biosynthesis